MVVGLLNFIFIKYNYYNLNIYLLTITLKRVHKKLLTIAIVKIHSPLLVSGILPRDCRLGPVLL